MALRTGAYGLKPVGPVDEKYLRVFTIAATADIGVYDPVELTDAGTIGLAAATNQDNLGVVMAIYDNDGIPQRYYDYSETTNTNWTAVVNTDPNQIYQVHYEYTTQLSITYVGNNVDWTAGSIATGTTGLSGLYIGAAPSAAQAQLQVVGIADIPDNTWSNAADSDSNYHYELLVKINEMINKTAFAGI